MRDELRVARKANGQALVVGDPEHHSIHAPFFREVDETPVIGDRLGTRAASTSKPFRRTSPDRTGKPPAESASKMV